MATAYIVFRALPAQEGSPDKSTFEIVWEGQANDSDQARSIYANTLAGELAEAPEGLTLAAVPARSWSPEDYEPVIERRVRKKKREAES